MDRNEVLSLKKEAENHLLNELLPFWITRMTHNVNGGFITHFDRNGNDSGEDEKSLIAQSRCLYSLYICPSGIMEAENMQSSPDMVLIS